MTYSISREGFKWFLSRDSCLDSDWPDTLVINSFAKFSVAVTQTNLALPKKYSSIFKKQQKQEK